MEQKKTQCHKLRSVLRYVSKINYESDSNPCPHQVEMYPGTEVVAILNAGRR